MTTQTKNSLLLMLCSFIWGFAFVAQSSGSGMGAYSFLAGRSWLAVLVLLPTVYAFDVLRRRAGEVCGWPKTKADRRLLLTAPSGLHGAEITLGFPSVGVEAAFAPRQRIGRPTYLRPYHSKTRQTAAPTGTSRMCPRLRISKRR